MVTDETNEAANGEPDLDPPVPPAFTVRDDASANWVIRHIVEARAYANRVVAWAERERRRALHDEEFFMRRFGHELAEYARRRIAEGAGRRKSLALPAGIAGFRHEGAKLIVDDEGVVIAWAKQHKPELVCIIERLSKSALNAHVEQTGEIPDAGVHVEPAREKFYVK